MKLRQLAIILLTGGIICGLFFWLHHHFFSPKAAFKRHFGSPIPESVSNISVSGYTAMARSDETLIFRIGEDDLSKLLRQRGFQNQTQKIQAGDLSPTWRRHIKHAKQLGITGSQFHEISKHNGLIYYVLITDRDSNLIYYHYSKT